MTKWLMNKNMELKNSIIHICSCNLNQSEEILGVLYLLLSDEEKIRTEKLKFNELRNRWIVSRGVLRLLISKYFAFTPKEIKFDFNAYGKPVLSKSLQPSGFSFNLSHSDNLAVYIFTRNRRVGIDLEKIKELEDMEDLTKLCFNDYEKNWFNKIPPSEKTEMFYRLWTSKEAYIKAIGKGFSFPPVNITLDLNDSKQLYFKQIIGDEDYKKWNIVEFKTNPDFISTVVIEGDDYKIEYFNLNLSKTGTHLSGVPISYSVEKINMLP